MTSNSQDHSNQTVVYVGHLPRNTTETLIHQIMEPVNGKITKISIHQKPLNAFAYVTFETHEEAARAIAECNYTKLNEQPIQVSWYESVPNNYAPDSKIIITNLPPSIDETQLHEALISYGAVVNCKILRNAKGEPTGRGNVQFESPDDARVAYEALQEAIIDDHQIKVDFYKPPDKRQDILLKLPPSVICVSGPESDVTTDNLREKFKQYGEILDVRIINGLGIVFFENQPSATRADAEFHDPSLNISTLVKKEIQQEVLKIVESQRAFISDLTVSSEEEIRQHLETAGKITYLEIRQQSNGLSTGLVQYESAEARDNAVQQLDRSFFSTQSLPIRVLPYFDKRLEHPKVGLLQLNEVPCHVTIPQLREEMKQFGNIIAITIIATSQVTCVGYVLYENYENAQKAHQESKFGNSFLYLPLSVNDIIGAFCDNLESRTIICYDIDQKETVDSFQKKVKIDTIDGIWMSEEENHKTIIFSCMTASSVPQYVNVLRTQGIDCDVLGIRIMNRCYKILNFSNFEPETRERLLYCTGLGRTTTNSMLRKAFETIGAVESAFVIYSPLNNESEGKGVVLFKDSADAAVAKQAPIISSDFETNFAVTEFKSKFVKDRSNPQPQPIQPPPQQMPQPMPQQMPQFQPQQYQQQHYQPYDNSQHQYNNQNHYNNQNQYYNNRNRNNGGRYRRGGGGGRNNNNHNGNRNNNNNQNQQNAPQIVTPRERMITYVKKNVTDNKQMQALIDEINMLSVNDTFRFGYNEYFTSVWVSERLKNETK